MGVGEVELADHRTGGPWRRATWSSVRTVEEDGEKAERATSRRPGRAVLGRFGQAQWRGRWTADRGRRGLMCSALQPLLLLPVSHIREDGRWNLVPGRSLRVCLGSLLGSGYL